MALKVEAEAHGWKNNQRIRHHISDLEDWLCHLERIQSPLRPNEPTTRIIWPSHYPRHQYQPRAHVKDIPQTVLAQLDAHLQYLPPRYIPIVLVLRASGWRISDVLFLKLDTRLEQEGDNLMNDNINGSSQGLRQALRQCYDCESVAPESGTLCGVG